MSRLNSHHKVLTNGKGKCSVPMWSGGCPSGFCDRDAFGFPTKYSRYDGYVPALACPAHGGPKEPEKPCGCDYNCNCEEDQKNYDADCDHYNTYGWSISH